MDIILGDQISNQNVETGVETNTAIFDGSLLMDIWGECSVLRCFKGQTQKSKRLACINRPQNKLRFSTIDGSYPHRVASGWKLRCDMVRQRVQKLVVDTHLNT